MAEFDPDAYLAQVRSDLPTGFTLDERSGDHGLPAGFTLDPPFDPDRYLKDTAPYGAGESAAEGYLKGASANWRDEVYGASEASGLPRVLGGFRAPVGAARLAYEKMTQPKSITGLVTGDQRGPVQKQYEAARDEKRRQEEAMQQQHPYAFGAGELGGAAATMLAAPELRATTALGRVGAGMATGAGYGALAGAGEAETPQNIIPEASKSAAAGTLLGGAGSAAVELASPLVRRASGLYHGLVDPEAEAVRRYAQAAERDVGSAGEKLTPQDLALAQRVGMPIGPVDTSGQAVRELARTASNFSPEAQASLKEFTQNRFEEQSPRIAGFIREITGGADASAELENIQAGARKANRPAYRAAYEAGANGLWTPELERLASSPAVRQAMQNAVQRGRDRAVAEGMGAFNPGVTFENGIMKFGQGKGAPPYPDMQYWDYVQRELRDTQNAARRSGRNEEASALGGLHRSLLAELDNANPAFQKARQGAAGFFGAEDALEAGQKFVKSSADIPAARKALAQLSQPERELFARGYASRLADAVERIGDNRDVLINQAFRSVAGRQRTELALGPGRAQQLEALLRIEGLVDQSRKVLGNSTTARQMIAAAVFGAGGDYAVEGHFDPTHMFMGALTGAAFPHAYQQVGQLVSRRVATQLGKLLTSNNPVDLAKGAKIAARDGAIMQRLRQLTSGVIGGAGTEAATQLLPNEPKQSFKHGGSIGHAAPSAEELEAAGLKMRAAGGGAGGATDETLCNDREHRAAGGRTERRRVPGELTNKASHEEVGYTDSSPRKLQSCGVCSKFFVAPNGRRGCLKVQSPIRATGWCRRFTRDPDVIAHEAELKKVK